MSLSDIASQPAPVAATGDVLVVASAVTASADLVLTSQQHAEYWRLQADGADVYITCGKAGDVTAPSITAVSGNGRAVKIPDGTHVDLQFSNPGRSTLRHISSATGGYFRLYRIQR